MSALFNFPDKDELLTPEEVADMTNSHRREGQIRWLNENGYSYEIFADGWPRVLRAYRMCRMMGIEPKYFIQAKTKPWELDLNTVS